MNRTLANVIIDLAALLFFVGMIATGYVLRFPLPPGTNRVLTLWGLTRHQWGSVHYGLSLGLLAIIAIHLVLHWKWIVTVIGKRLHMVSKPQPSMVRSGVLVGGVFAVAFGLFALAVHWSVKEMAQPLHDLDLPNANAVGATSGPALVAKETPSRFGDWDEVASVLQQRCVSCHGSKRELGGFRADLREDFFGRNGKPPFVVPGNSAESPLIAIVSGERSEMRMSSSHKLPDQEVLLLRAWIDAGADWPDEQ